MGQQFAGVHHLATTDRYDSIKWFEAGLVGDQSIQVFAATVEDEFRLSGSDSMASQIIDALLAQGSRGSSTSKQQGTAAQVPDVIKRITPCSWPPNHLGRGQGLVSHTRRGIRTS
jgi:hypothetical protein